MTKPRGQRCEQPSGNPSPALEPSMLAEVLEAIADGIVVLDAAGAPIYWNLAAERLLPRLTQSVALAAWPEVHGLYLPDGATPAPPDQLPWLAALRGEVAPAAELLVRTPEAEQSLWVSATAAPLRDAAGKSRGALLVLRDVTEARRAQQTLRRERDWAATIVDTVGSLVVVLDRAGRIVTFNRACELTTGYTFEEVLGREVWDLFLPAEQIESVREVFERLRGGDFPNQHENDWLTRDGRRRTIMWSNTVLLGAEGQVEYVIGTGVDVTERRAAERKARELDQTLRALLEASPLAIWAVDLEGRLQFWNSAAERMFGWTQTEVLDQPLAVLSPEQPAEFRELLERFDQGEALHGIERPYRRKDGALLELRLWAAPLRDAEGRLTAMLGVASEITEQKRLQQQLQQAQKMEAIGRLAGGVAHDFNNLLTIITGYGQMLAENLPEQDPLSDAAAEILRAAASASELTRRLLTFSRKRMQTQELLELNEVVAGVEKMLRRVIGEDVELVTALDPQTGWVRADRVQIEQMLLNLAVNAREAMPQGGRIVIETAPVVLDQDYARTHVGVAPGRYAMLAVSDTGCGMDAETLRQAFEPFFTTKAGGTGLGLSTVYGLVRQHNGHIWVYSEPGVGTTFKIYLPLAQQPAPQPERPIAPRLSRGQETILVVEDQRDLRRLIAEVLRREGYTVLVARDVEDALRIVAEHAGVIDLLLTDVVMPAMGGRELARRILEARPAVKVLFMSGYGDRAVVHNGMLEEQAPFLEKPFTKQLLLRKVREALES